MDQLREERQHIEAEIESSSILESTEIRMSGYREMNERLRRRIYEVREYIQKMTYENQRIEEGIISNQYVEEEALIRRKEAVQAVPTYEGRRMNRTGLEGLVQRVHEKYDEAERRAKRQVEDIDRRNSEVRSRMGKTTNTYYSPKARTYFSPNREIY